MKFWSYIHISVLVLFFTSLQARGAENIWEEKAARLFPHSQEIPTFTSLKSTFEPIMYREVDKKFEAYFEIMYRADFPKPVHPLATIINGFRCLYVKMNKANERATEQERLTDQLNALDALFALHKNQISLFNPDLAEKIKGFGCDECKANAKMALGMESEHLGYAELKNGQSS